MAGTSVRHGWCGTPEYRAWKHMKSRCVNPNVPEWKYYGGRGITVCPEWIASFPTFLAHVGPRPSSQHSLDRIDNDRGYEPGNVRWASSKEQRNNQRRPGWYRCKNGHPFTEENTRWYTHSGKTFRRCIWCMRAKRHQRYLETGK